MLVARQAVFRACVKPAATLSSKTAVATLSQPLSVPETAVAISEYNLHSLRSLRLTAFTALAAFTPLFQTCSWHSCRQHGLIAGGGSEISKR